MELELIDYIDADEGRDFPRDVEEQPVCESCGEEAVCLTYQSDWDFFACPDCLRDCVAQLDAEEECTCVRMDVDYYDASGCAAHGVRRAA